jgi:hypothetical protein
MNADFIGKRGFCSDWADAGLDTPASEANDKVPADFKISRLEFSAIYLSHIDFL